MLRDTHLSIVTRGRLSFYMQHIVQNAQSVSGARADFDKKKEK